MNGNHPNATVAAVSAGAAALLAWLLRSRGVDLNPEQSALIAGMIGAGVLYVGKRGIRGAARDLWAGASSIVNGKPSSAKK